MEQRPVVTGQSEFATARLPPGDEAENVAMATNGVAEGVDPHDILGVLPEDNKETIRHRARGLKKKNHPDNQGGEEEQFKRVVAAEQQLLGEG